MSIGLTILFGMLSPVPAQKVDQRPPVVVAGKLPLYPVMAHIAGIYGVVKIKVTTDGKKVTSVDAKSGPPMLVKSAKENILTWEFTEHKPTTFVTTFEYVIERPAQCNFSNDTLTLKLPLEVRISARAFALCDPGVLEIKPHR